MKLTPFQVNFTRAFLFVVVKVISHVYVKSTFHHISFAQTQLYDLIIEEKTEEKKITTPTHELKFCYE